MFRKSTLNAAQRHIEGVRYSWGELRKKVNPHNVTDPKLLKAYRRADRARVNCEVIFHDIERGFAPTSYYRAKPVTRLWVASRSFYNAVMAMHDILFPTTPKF